MLACPKQKYVVGQLVEITRGDNEGMRLFVLEAEYISESARWVYTLGKHACRLSCTMLIEEADLRAPAGGTPRRDMAREIHAWLNQFTVPRYDGHTGSHLVRVIMRQLEERFMR